VSRVHWTRGGIALGLAAGLLLPAAASAETRTLTMRFGPVDMHGYETGTGVDRTPAPHVDGSITSMYAHLVDRAGRPIPQQHVMLHHVLFTNQSHGGIGDCRNAKAEAFYGTGEEDQRIEMPPGYGYRVRAKDRWKVGWMFMNHRHTTDRVYLQYTVTVSDEPLKPVTPYWISASCAKGKIYSVPGGGGPDSVHRRSRTWVVPKSGRIIAAAAHAHGGALRISAARKGCGELLASESRYGAVDDPIYNLSPVLHEPAPRSMSVLTSAQGWPVRKGDRLKVTSEYSNAHPHSAVMGILHLYIARGGGRTTRCPAPPADAQPHRLPFPGFPGRERPPDVSPQLSALDSDGVARPVLGALPGPLRTTNGDATVTLRNAMFRPRRLSVPRGSTVRWRFRDPIQHDVTLASGPRAFASAYYKGPARYRKTLTTPGEYRIFCSLHPVTMSQTIEVR
jgi:plastocyanin